MVSPLCDKWGADLPYRWTLPGQEPFPQGDANHMLTQQIMMAETFGWDPLFLASLPFQPKNGSVLVSYRREQRSDTITRITASISTPYGDLTQIVDESNNTQCLVKDYLSDEADFRRMIWLTEQQMDIDENTALAQGAKIREAVGERGMTGTWVGTSAMMADISVLFFHEADYPEEFTALFKARKELLKSSWKFTGEPVLIIFFMSFLEPNGFLRISLSGGCLRKSTKPSGTGIKAVVSFSGTPADWRKNLWKKAITTA